MDALVCLHCNRVFPAEWVHCDQCSAVDDNPYIVPVEIVDEIAESGSRSHAATTEAPESRHVPVPTFVDSDSDRWRWHYGDEFTARLATGGASIPFAEIARECGPIRWLPRDMWWTVGVAADEPDPDWPLFPGMVVTGDDPKLTEWVLDHPGMPVRRRTANNAPSAWGGWLPASHHLYSASSGYQVGRDPLEGIEP